MMELLLPFQKTVMPSPTPDSWKLNEIFAIGVVLGAYQAVLTVVVFWAMKSTDFFSENFRQHLVEELRNIFLLFEAVDLSKELQRTTMEGYIAEMQETHSHFFGFLMGGLQPHEALQYMDLVMYSLDKDKAHYFTYQCLLLRIIELWIQMENLLCCQLLMLLIQFLLCMKGSAT